MAVFVMSRRGTWVRPVIMNLFLMLPLRVMARGRVLDAVAVECRMLLSVMILWLAPGTLTLTVSPLGTGSRTCILGSVMVQVTPWSNVAICLIPMSGLSLTLHCAMAGFCANFAIWVLTVNLLRILSSVVIILLPVWACVWVVGLVPSEVGLGRWKLRVVVSGSRLLAMLVRLAM